MSDLPDTPSPLWLLPRGPLSGHWSSVDNWTILLTPDIGKSDSCRWCSGAESSVLSLVREWTSYNPQPMPPNASVAESSYARMAAAVTALRRGAVNVLMTSDPDPASLNKSMSRLILDNQPDGVKGIEYYGERFTPAAYHFLHRPEVITSDNPCKYRLRRRMNPLWTVGVRCQASKADGNYHYQHLMLIDHRSPPVFSSAPKFSVSDFSDSFYDYDGLWAMFPSFLTSSGRSSSSSSSSSSIDAISVWGLWAQRLLQETGAEMAITSLQCPRHVKKMKVSSAAPRAKAQMAYKFVRNWQCPFDKKFLECASILGQSLQQADLVRAEEVKLLQVWIGELRKARYVEPRRTSSSSSSSRSSEKDLLLGCIIHSPARVLPQAREIERGNPFPNIYPFCKNLPGREDVVNPFQNHQLIRSKKVEDIVLVIIFYDASIYANIRFLEDIYARYFPHLIYCGPNFNTFQTVYRSLNKPLSYIEVPDTKGFVAYECVSRAIMMNYDVSGYLEMADDVILNSWNLGNIPRDRFWFQKDLRTASRHQQIMNDFALSYPFPWWPWTVHGQMWGAKAMARVWRRFESIQTFNGTRGNQIVTGFLQMLQHNSGSYDRFFYCSSDIFYVPARFRQPWAMLSDIFFNNNVFLDIAVPTLMNGLDLTANIVRMEGVYLWYNERGNYPAHYRSHHQFFHPWKMGWIHRSDHANFLCFHLLPNIVGDLMATKSRGHRGHGGHSGHSNSSSSSSSSRGSSRGSKKLGNGTLPKTV